MSTKVQGIEYFDDEPPEAEPGDELSGKEIPSPAVIVSDEHRQYDNPLIGRYASAAMSELWGPQRKFSTWRRLWVALAEAEAELGLPVSQGQIAELKRYVDAIDFEAAQRHERRLRHDVMAHVHAYGDVCPAPNRSSTSARQAAT